MKNTIKALMFIIMIIANVKLNTVFGQCSNPTNAIGGTDYLGSSNTNDIMFKANGTLYMTLKYNTGYLGIGTATPATILDIAPTVANMGYGINGATVLHNYGTQNIFVGEGAGANNGGSQNAALGFEAGKNNNDAGNVFIGYQAAVLYQWATPNISLLLPGLARCCRFS